MLKTNERFLGILDTGASHYQKTFQSYPSAFAMAKQVAGWMAAGKDGELVYATPQGDHTLVYTHKQGRLVPKRNGTDFPVRYYRMTSLEPPLAKGPDSGRPHRIHSPQSPPGALVSNPVYRVCPDGGAGVARREASQRR